LVVAVVDVMNDFVVSVGCHVAAHIAVVLVPEHIEVYNAEVVADIAEVAAVVLVHIGT
jgi:hypothetical protein